MKNLKQFCRETDIIQHADNWAGRQQCYSRAADHMHHIKAEDHLKQMPEAHPYIFLKNLWKEPRQEGRKLTRGSLYPYNSSCEWASQNVAALKLIKPPTIILLLMKATRFKASYHQKRRQRNRQHIIFTCRWLNKSLPIILWRIFGRGVCHKESQESSNDSSCATPGRRTWPRFGIYVCM